MIDLTKISNIEFDGISHRDYPDYCDAYISSAEIDGVQLTEHEIEEVNENRDFLHEKLFEHLY